MLPSEMLDSFRDHLDLEDDFITKARTWERLFQAQQRIVRVIARLDPTYYMESESISLVANQALYSVPITMRLGARIVFIENTQYPDTPQDVPPIAVKQRMNYTQGALQSLVPSFVFSWEGSKLRISPTPSSSSTGTIVAWHIPSLGNMLQGTAAAGGSNTLTCFAGAPNWTSSWGEYDPRPDYYKHLTLYIYEGAGAGQERKISASTSARVFTVTEDWDTQPDTTSKFAVMCPVVEDYHEVVVLNACLTGSIKLRNRGRALNQEYYGNPNSPGLYRQMVADLAVRQESEHEVVEPADYNPY